ncbi:MAG: sugar transferase [Solirubrobacterales bacterium]
MRAARLRRWGLASADTLAIVVGVVVAFAVEEANSGTQTWAILLVPVWILTAKLYGLYDNDDRRLTHHTAQELPNLVATAAVSVVAWKALTMLLGADPRVSSASVVIIGAVAGVSSAFLRSGIRTIARRTSPPERTLIIGSGEKAFLVASRLERYRKNEGGIAVIGFVTDDQVDGDREPVLQEHDFLGSLEDLPNLLEREQVSRVVIAKDASAAEKTGPIIDLCLSRGVAATLVPVQSEVLGPAAEITRVADVPVIEFNSTVVPRSTLAIKRTVDITVSSALLALASPILLVSAVAVVSTSRGPVFFRQTRIGKDGRPFTMLKLRTMQVDAEDQLDDLIDLDNLDQPAFKIENDPRVTPVGRVLRRFSIDEIPQFINVLDGSMSLVGPRPEEEAVVALYDERQRTRLAVKPGLTGPMQVEGRGALSFEERLSLERDYIENLSIGRDIELILRTPRAILRGDESQ